MIDFACTQFDLDDIIKCGLGLTKAEFGILKYFLKHPDQEFTTLLLSKELDLNLTTIQKAVKKLSDNSIVLRHKKNLENGGYLYTYECNSKRNIRKIIKEIIRNWASKVEEEIDRW